MSFIFFQMFWYVIFQYCQMSCIDSHLRFYFQDLFLFSFIIHPGYSTEFKPSIILLIVSKFSQDYINWISIFRKYNVMRNAKLNKFVCDETEHEGHRIGDLGRLIIVTQGSQDPCITHWSIDFLNLDPHIIQINLLCRIHKSAFLP